MDLSPRQSDILNALRRAERVEVETLATAFAVTTQTIRRDLAVLCEQGLAARTHGGARSLNTVADMDYRARRQTGVAAKAAIGARTAQLIPNNCSLAMNIGTTTEQVARCLGDHKGLMVVSNNINIITGMLGAGGHELILAGGSVRQADGAIIGPDAVEFIRRYKVDYAVIGTSALDEDGAVLDFDSAEVAVARAILANARCRILVADRSKFQRSAPVRICDLGGLQHFVTDLPPPPAFALAAVAAGTQIHVTQPQEAPHES
ncbi:MAG: DeoR/GlpR family DNA-binding transcription regulator [Pseudomonadota bacterium]